MEFLLVLLIVNILIQVGILKNFSLTKKIAIIIINVIFCTVGTIILYNLSLKIDPIKGGSFAGMGRVIMSILSFFVKFCLLNNVLLFYLNRMGQRDKQIIKSIYIILLYIPILSAIEYFVILTGN